MFRLQGRDRVYWSSVQGLAVYSITIPKYATIPPYSRDSHFVYCVTEQNGAIPIYYCKICSCSEMSNIKLTLNDFQIQVQIIAHVCSTKSHHHILIIQQCVSSPLKHVRCCNLKSEWLWQSGSNSTNVQYYFPSPQHINSNYQSI